MAKTHRAHARKILAQLEAHESISQRALAQNLGIALGLTNLLLRRLVGQGWVEVSTARPNHPRYLLTPAGVAERNRQKRHRHVTSVRLYSETREVIRRRLEALSAEWRQDGHGNGNGNRATENVPNAAAGAKRIIFYGAGEVAEIGYVSLQGTDLQLVAVVDDTRVGPFFDVAVKPSAWLMPNGDNGDFFHYIVIMSFNNVKAIRQRLEGQGLPPDRIVSL